MVRPPPPRESMVRTQPPHTHDTVKRTQAPVPQPCPLPGGASTASGIRPLVVSVEYSVLRRSSAVERRGKSARGFLARPLTEQLEHLSGRRTLGGGEVAVKRHRPRWRRHHGAAKPNLRGGQSLPSVASWTLLFCPPQKGVKPHTLSVSGQFLPTLSLVSGREHVTLNRVNTRGRVVPPPRSPSGKNFLND